MLLERTREVADATRRPARIAAGVMGGLFLLAGILGFIPGVTSDYSSMACPALLEANCSACSGVGAAQPVAPFLGVAGWPQRGKRRVFRPYLLLGGLVYLALWFFGVLLDFTTVDKLFG